MNNARRKLWQRLQNTAGHGSAELGDDVKANHRPSNVVDGRATGQKAENVIHTQTIKKMNMKMKIYTTDTFFYGHAWNRQLAY